MTASPTRGWALAAGAASLGLLLAGPSLLIAVGASWNALQGRPAAPVVCEYRARTGRACLGCGGTRALELAARGRLREAFARNPLGAWAGLWLWIGGVGGAVAGWTGRLPARRQASVLLLTSGVLAFLVNFAWWWRGLGPG